MDEAYAREAILLHELAHQFGIIDDMDETHKDRSHNGIMEYSSDFLYPYFTGAQLRTIRDRGFPGSLEP